MEKIEVCNYQSFWAVELCYCYEEKLYMPCRNIDLKKGRYVVKGESVRYIYQRQVNFLGII